jgi:hypothetical protein
MNIAGAHLWRSLPKVGVHYFPNRESDPLAVGLARLCRIYGVFCTVTGPLEGSVGQRD